MSRHDDPADDYYSARDTGARPSQGTPRADATSRGDGPRRGDGTRKGGGPEVDADPSSGHGDAGSASSGSASSSSGSSGSASSGSGSTGSGWFGDADSAGSASSTDGARSASSTDGAGERRRRQGDPNWETFRVSGDRLLETVKRIVREGNARRIVIRNDEDRVLLEFPLTAGVVGAALLPMWAAVGAVAALVGNCSIEVERKSES